MSNEDFWDDFEDVTPDFPSYRHNRESFDTPLLPYSVDEDEWRYEENHQDHSKQTNKRSVKNPFTSKNSLRNRATGYQGGITRNKNKPSQKNNQNHNTQKHNNPQKKPKYQNDQNNQQKQKNNQQHHKPQQQNKPQQHQQVKPVQHVHKQPVYNNTLKQQEPLIVEKVVERNADNPKSYILWVNDSQVISIEEMKNRLYINKCRVVGGGWFFKKKVRIEFHSAIDIDYVLDELEFSGDRPRYKKL